MLLVPSSPATLLLPPAPALQPRARVFLPGLQHSPFLKAGPQRGGLPWPPSAGFLLERLRRHPTPAGVRPVWPGALIYDFLVSPQAPGATKAGNPAAGEGFGTLVPRKCVEQANNVCKSRLLLQVAAISWPLRGLVCRCFSQCLTCWHLALLHSSWGLGCLGGWSFRGLRME